MLETPKGQLEVHSQFIGPGPLKETEVYRLRDHYGFNTVNTSTRGSWQKLILESLFHPFNILLILLSITSGFAGEYETMGIMLIMVALSTLLRFHQEWKSQTAVESLLSFVATKCTVIRNDMVLFKDLEMVVPSNELVPGDWIKLGPGDLIPADVELINSKEFHVSQAALTGEAIPVLKYNRGRQGSWASPTEAILKGAQVVKDNIEKRYIRGSSPSNFSRSLGNRLRSIFGLASHNEGNKNEESDESCVGVNFSDMDRPDVCFMGSAVVSGKATGRVINSGPLTIFGKLAKELMKKQPANNFQLGVRRISWLFFFLTICMVPPVLLLQGILQHDWFKAFMFALSVAVGLTPEMLPMIVNTTLAKGAMEMSKKNCIVKNLDAINMMGAVDVLCTDKTGTLTNGVVTLNKFVNGKGSTSPLPLIMAYLNAHFQTCHQNPLDFAIIQFYQGNHGDEIKNRFEFLEEIPFDFERRRLSVVVKATKEDSQVCVLICKGAVEEILAICNSILMENYGGSQDLDDCIHGNCKVDRMTDDKVGHLQRIYQQFSGDGLRVIAVAYKIVAMETDRQSFGIQEESEMIFVGFLAFLDPPKESTKQAIQDFMERNVNVKVLTGDNLLVCKKICSEIGIKVDQVITGQELAAMATGLESESFTDLLKTIVEEHSIFAKLTPIQKLDIVKALKMNGHIVGFLGDGINDAPALSEADVGISVDTGMDICKESANIILLEKDLTVLNDAIIIGRATYGNTIKYIVMGMSSNFGNVFSILVASAWLPFQPMASLHILMQNLLYDASQMGIPWDNMDSEYLLVPHEWSMKRMVRLMVFIGPWSSLFDIGTFLFLYYYFGIQTGNSEDEVRIFQSSWFCVGMVTQTLLVHIIRTPKIPFFESWASIQLTVMTGLLMILGLSLPYIPGLNKRLMLTPLPLKLFPFLGAVIICYCAVVQIAKTLYLRLFNEWY